LQEAQLASFKYPFVTSGIFPGLASLLPKTKCSTSFSESYPLRINILKQSIVVTIILWRSNNPLLVKVKEV
jgi:hypothetical protein